MHAATHTTLHNRCAAATVTTASVTKGVAAPKKWNERVGREGRDDLGTRRTAGREEEAEAEAEGVVEEEEHDDDEEFATPRCMCSFVGCRLHGTNPPHACALPFWLVCVCVRLRVFLPLFFFFFFFFFFFLERVFL